MYARIDIGGLAGRFGILPIIVIKSVLNNGRYTPNFTIIMNETHTTAYYRNKVGTMYHAAEFEDLTWYIM